MYILVCTYTCLDVQTKNSMYWYILVCTDHVTGFRPRGLGGGQAVRTFPNTVSVRGSSREHGQQSSPYALFLAGNSTPTISHLYSKHKDTGFPMGCADAAAVDGRRGSNIYEVNPWLWQFGNGTGKPRLGGLSVVDTQERKEAANVERNMRAAETRRRRKADRA